MHPGAIAAERPTRDAVVLGSTRRSYAELDRASRRLAVRARARGLARGDVLAVLARNGPEFMAGAWAAQRSGLYLLPLGTRLYAADLAYILGDSGARFLLADAEHGSLATAALDQLPAAQRPVLEPLGDSLWATGAAPPDPDPVEGGDMLYTSGTTGRPKGVRRPLAHAPLGSELARAARLQELFAMDGSSVFLSPAPLYHAAPLRFAMALLRLGGTLLLMPRFDAADALALIDREGVTHSQWVPTMFARLLALPAAAREAYRGRRHRVAIHAGAPCPQAQKRAMIDWWGPILQEYYSGTESVGFTHIRSEEWLRKPGSVGRPWRCALHIVGDDGRELPPGERGTVYFSGRGAPAYHNAPEKTADATLPNGWSTMGDIGYVDEDGYLFLTDRRAFTIISGGVNVYPQEVEDALREHPAVAEAAVFGSADRDLGEIVTAVVSPAPGATADLALARDIYAAAALRLARFKLPRVLAFQAELPHTDSGKLHKAQLRERWRQSAAIHYDHRQLKAEL